MEAWRSAVRVNVSMGLVFMGLLAEVMFVALLGYSLIRAVHLIR
jgi:hypothetical protein